MQQQQLGLADYMAMLKRRRWTLVSVAAVVTLGAVIAAFTLPELYRSKAYIAINKPEVAIDGGAPAYDTGLRVQLMTERVLAWDNLEAIMLGYDLYPELKNDENPLRARVAELNANIEIAPVEAETDPRARRPSEVIGFEIAYLHAEPEIAQKVVADIAALFLFEDQRGRTETAAEATSFLQDESTKLEEQLAEIEADLAKFKARNAGRLPENAGLNMQGLERSERELDDTERELRSLQERRALLYTQLRQTPKKLVIYDADGKAVQGAEERLQALQRELVSLSARYGPEHPDVIKVRREIEILTSGAAADSADSLRQAIAAQNAALNDALSRYSADHPDVRRIERTIDNLNSQLTTIEEAGNAASGESEPDNPEYLELEIQLNRADEELTALRVRRNDLRRKITEYESRLATTPEIERQLSSLVRDYEVTLRKYEEIGQGLNKTKMLESAVEEQKAEHYELTRPAGLPSSPAKPNRPVIIILGMFFAITLGFVAAIVAELIDSAIRNSRDVFQVMEMPPIAVIPQIMNTDDIRRRLRRRIAIAAGAVGTIAATVVYIA